MFNDPRPDLERDSNLWELFISITYLADEQLAYILHGFRCGGARLLKSNNGYVMRPEFNHNSLWDNQVEYEQDRKKFLMPYAEKIVDCLNRLGGK